MPTVLRAGPYRFFFWSNEAREPPHIHVESSRGYAKLWLDPVSVARADGYTPGDLRRVRHLVEQNRAILLNRWNEHFGNA